MSTWRLEALTVPAFSCSSIPQARAGADRAPTDELSLARRYPGQRWGGHNRLDLALAYRLAPTRCCSGQR